MSGLLALEKKDAQVLLKLLSNSLFDAEHTFDGDIDWQEVFSESLNQTVAAVALDGVGNTAVLPQEIMLKWVSSAGTLLKQNGIVNANHEYVDKLMKQHNIPYCILKGAASEYYYSKPFLRAMGDVDFIVPDDKFDEASDIFVTLGFKMTGEEFHCHREFKKGTKYFEMHFEPAGVPQGENGEKVKEHLSDIFEKTSFVSLSGASFENPSPFHHGLVMLLHTYHHMLSEGIGLRHLCDWAVFVNNFSTEEFCEIFEEKLKSIGLWKFACVLSATASDHLGMPYKEWIGDVDKQLTSALINDILKGGNFGRKQENRSQQGSMISNRGENGVKKSKLLQLIVFKNRQAAEHHAFFKNNKLFYPFGFIFLAIRYAIHVITGRRKKLNIGAISKEAEIRKNIYMQFALFEKEE